MPDRTDIGASGPLEEFSTRDLEELCKVHSISLELIRKSHSLDDLLDLILDELERRLSEIPSAAFRNRGSVQRDSDDTARLKALVTFTSQAAELKAKAEVNQELQRALDAAESGRDRLEGVMNSVAAGIAVLDTDQNIVHANSSMAELLGSAGYRGGRTS